MPVGGSVTAPTESRDQASPTAWDRLFRVSSLQFSAITRATPLSTLGHIVNVTISLFAFQASVPWDLLAIWAAGSYAVAAYVFFRWATRSRRARRTEVSRSATRKAIIYGAALAAPWGVLGCWLLGALPQQQELILIALCVGMSASGSVLLSATYPAALTYMACILAPVAIKCFLVLQGREYVLLGALTLSYAVFLLNCINSLRPSVCREAARCRRLGQKPGRSRKRPARDRACGVARRADRIAQSAGVPQSLAGTERA